MVKSNEAYLPSPRLALYPSGVCGGVLGDMEEEEMKPNKEFEVNLHVTSIEKGKPSRPDYEDEAMTNLTDEGLRGRA